jgi:hypothetical protein
MESPAVLLRRIAEERCRAGTHDKAPAGALISISRERAASLDSRSGRVDQRGGGISNPMRVHGTGAGSLPRHGARTGRSHSLSTFAEGVVSAFFKGSIPRECRSTAEDDCAGCGCSHPRFGPGSTIRYTKLPLDASRLSTSGGSPIGMRIRLPVVAERAATRKRSSGTP